MSHNNGNNANNRTKIHHSNSSIDSTKEATALYNDIIPEISQNNDSESVESDDSQSIQSREIVSNLLDFIPKPRSVSNMGIIIYFIFVSVFK